MSEKQRTVQPHDIMIKGRRNLSVTGVEEVLGCDEELLSIKTVMGKMTIAGKQLHIGSFNRSTGELQVDGEIKELFYEDVDLKKQGLFSRLFR